MPPPPRPILPTGNKILAALNDVEARGFFPHLERVSLTQGEVVYEAECRIGYVYFPETAVFSMLCVMESGDTVEVGPVGDEGLVGLRVFLGADTSPDRVIVHVAGTALRLRAGALREEVGASGGEMPAKLLRYTRMLLAMTGRSGCCYKLHRLEPQLARWLLTMGDYVGEELRLTHDLMALTLGARRASVTEAASTFRAHGFIDYHRGHIRVVDRGGVGGRGLRVLPGHQRRVRPPVCRFSEARRVRV